ncbi:Uncharacterised protein [Vibrio cholerae]|nr:Uncharacterised protein [Vibrio cholerae]CSB22378.1 Uncharacterised protein [Vibrio cholerae]CSC02769.1 Uncharacterised protein [Vibrio cholerae]CSC74442.1 Uncharacterised protein [Vibrio cholerae]CSC85355.1 Uncharacterised protein [Vibrio cholerae]
MLWTDVALFNDFWLTEKIALEEGKTRMTRLMKLIFGFDSFCQKSATTSLSQSTTHKFTRFIEPHCHDVDFDYLYVG